MERSGREVPPHDAGMSRAAVDAIERAMRGLYDTGTQPAIALCLRRRGHVVFDRAVGESHPGQKATPDTPFCVFSASKAVTAMIIHLLDGRNLLRIDDPVAEYIPEFARHGKEHTTIRHVLTHRAGIPSLAGHADPSLLGDWDHIVRLLCDAHPVSVPGRRLAYHAITGGFVLGEIVRRVTGKTVRQVLQEEVTDPLGLRWFNYGVRPEDMHAVARNAFTGPPVPKGLAYLVERALGVPFERAVTVSNERPFLTSIIPSGNIVATANELSTFFQLLLDGGELDGVRVFDAKTVQRARTESSYLEVDLTLGLPVRYGLGLMLAGNHFSPFGPRTPQAFGHYGFINIVGWADPQRELSCALLTSGKPFLGTHLIAFWKLLASIAKSVPD
ncbi:MAG TPA: serine hydrolase domain-containing protein [Polyangiaceae bacterium]